MTAKPLPIVPAPVGRTALDPRAAAVAKYREVADRIESGQLHGARVEWRHGLKTIRAVEVDRDQVRYTEVVAGADALTSLDAKELPFDVTKAQLLAVIDTLVGQVEELQARLQERE